MAKLDKLKLYKELLEFCNISGISYNGSDYLIHTSVGIFTYVDSETFKNNYSENIKLFNHNKKKNLIANQKAVKAIELLSKRYDVYLYSYLNDMNNDYHNVDTIVFNLFLNSEEESEFYQNIDEYYVKLLGKKIDFKLTGNELIIAKIIKRIQETLRSDFINSLNDRDWYGFMKTTCKQLDLVLTLAEKTYTYPECVSYLEKVKIIHS